MKTTLKDIRSYVATNAAEDLTKKQLQRLTQSALRNADLRPSHTAPAFTALLAYWSRATPPASCTPSPHAHLHYSRLCDRRNSKMITLDFSQWAALWYVGGMISGALVMIAFLNS